MTDTKKDEEKPSEDELARLGQSLRNEFLGKEVTPELVTLLTRRAEGLLRALARAHRCEPPPVHVREDPADRTNVLIEMPRDNIPVPDHTFMGHYGGYDLWFPLNGPESHAAAAVVPGGSYDLVSQREAIAECVRRAREVGLVRAASAGQRSAGPYSIGSDRWPGLSKLTEECGEVLQVVGKLLGNGGQEQHWDGTNLRVRLEQEIGDVVAAVLFVTDKCGLSKDAIDVRTQHKLGLFLKWHSEQE